MTCDFHLRPDNPWLGAGVEGLEEVFEKKFLADKELLIHIFQALLIPISTSLRTRGEDCLVDYPSLLTGRLLCTIINTPIVHHEKKSGVAHLPSLVIPLLAHQHRRLIRRASLPQHNLTRPIHPSLPLLIQRRQHISQDSLCPSTNPPTIIQQI